MSKPSDYKVGEYVYVHTYGYWYEGKVVKIGRSLLHVEYTTGSGTTRVKKCKMDQVSREKHEGERAEAGARKRERNRKEQEMWDKAFAEDRFRVHLKIEWKHHLDPVRCMAAFQALQWPPGFFKGTTHAQARKIIEDCTGLKFKKRAKPERNGPMTLEKYLEWASQPENHEPLDMDNLPPGMHMITIAPEEEKAAS